MSPSLFNVYLEHALDAVPELKQALNESKIYGFADDLLLVCDSEEEAAKLINGVKKLKDVANLTLNETKSAILTDLRGIQEKTQIEGIPIVQKF